MQKMLLRKFRSQHRCEVTMTAVSTRCTAKSRDDLIYTFDDDFKYRLFKVVKINGDQFLCREFNVTPKTYNRVTELDFSTVGVFNNHGHKTNTTVVTLSDVKGKVFSMGSILMTIPINVLTEH